MVQKLVGKRPSIFECAYSDTCDRGQGACISVASYQTNTTDY